MNSPHHHHHHDHHDVHQQRLLWFFSFCNQRSSSSSNSSSAGSNASHERSRRGCNSRRKTTSNRNKFALQYQQQLQQQQRQSSNVFGLDLTEHTQRYCDDDSIPYIVKSCTRFIEKHGIIFGIYRLSGMRVNIHKLRQDFDKNPKISMIDNEAISNDAHAVACVLKQYFRELPTPLLTFHMYEKFIELFKQSKNDHKTEEQHNTDQQDKADGCKRPATTRTQSNDYSQKSADAINDQEQYYDTQEQDDNDEEKRDEIHAIDDDKNCDDIRVDDTRTQTPDETISNRTSESNINRQIAREQQSMKSKSSIIGNQSSNLKLTQQAKHKKPFTTSASDSQLISLSSVVTTTASDIKYQVNLDDLKQLLLQLPRAHYQTLKFLMRHLACIATNGKRTGMDSKNVAIVWAPNLLKPRELELSAGLETLQVIGLQAVITEQLIKHHKFLFDDDENKQDFVEPTDLTHDKVEEEDSLEDEFNKSKQQQQDA